LSQGVGFARQSCHDSSVAVRTAPHPDGPAFVSIADVPFLQARARGAKLAIAHDGGTLDYAGLDGAIRRLAGFLGERGVGAGQRVAILLPNLPEVAVAYFGAIAAGAVAVPVNLRLSPPEVGYVLKDSGAAALVSTPAQLARLAGEPALQGLKLRLSVGGQAPGALPFAAALEAAPRPAPAPVAPGDVATLLYTSGTTGFPKGAMISHANALFNARSCQRALGYAEGDVALVTLPMFHVTALHTQLVAMLAVGASLVIQSEYDTERLLELVGRHGVTSLFLVPAIYKLLTLRADPARHRLDSVSFAGYGGAPMPPETIEAVQRLLPGVRLCNCYGLTESSSLATVLPPELALSRSTTVGRPVPEVEAEVRDPHGEKLPPGQAGELFLRGPNIVQGYWGAPEKTAQALGDGWLRTGDLARIDADGLVTILDRVKDMINRGGEKIYGLEVEHVLAAFPGVAEAAVVGMPHPIFGEVPAAFLVAVPGTELSLDALRRHCGERLADFKIPVEFRVVPQLPRNPAGKVLKQELRRALPGPAGGAA
jgi:O-succinylbenzoic acid--CoA ligase